MSALGSSVINKSNKKYAPRKAPVRRLEDPSNETVKHAAPARPRDASAQENASSDTIPPLNQRPKKHIELDTQDSGSRPHIQSPGTLKELSNPSSALVLTSPETSKNSSHSHAVPTPTAATSISSIPLPHSQIANEPPTLQNSSTDTPDDRSRMPRAKRRKLQSVNDVDKTQCYSSNMGQGNGDINQANDSECQGLTPSRQQNFGSDEQSSQQQDIGTSQAVATRPSISSENKNEKAKRRRKAAIEKTAKDIVEDAVSSTKKSSRRQGRKSQYREETPEDGETMTISTSTMTMTELCKDQGIGKRSSRQRDLKVKDQEAYVQKKQKQLQDLVEDEVVEPPDPHNPSSTALPETVVALPELNVPKTVIVNGQIQIDEDSLRIDRHAVADRERLERQDLLGPIEEDDLSRQVNSASFMKREKGGRWTTELLDLFYQGLQMFGTDFEMISRMFPGKTRRGIKLRFCKEEKSNHAKIKAALLGQQVPVVLEEYERVSGSQYQHPLEFERLLEEDRRALEEEHAAEKEAIEQAQRDREAQAAAESAAAALAEPEHGGRRRGARQGTEDGDHSSSRRGRRARQAEIGLN